MRCARLALSALALVTVAATASADTYQDLRRQPAVRQAVDAMPGGINGSLGRLSNALDGTTFLNVTQNDERRLIAALEAVETDLRSGLPSLGIVDRLTLAQTVNRTAIPVIPGIFPNAGLPPCDEGFAQWHDSCHAHATIVADRIAELFEGTIRAGVDAYRLEHPSAAVPPVPLPPPPGIAAENFSAWLHTTLSAIGGSIDGVETIDVE